jgi:hypothetical protein
MKEQCDGEHESGNRTGKRPSGNNAEPRSRRHPSANIINDKLALSAAIVKRFPMKNETGAGRKTSHGNEHSLQAELGCPHSRSLPERRGEEILLAAPDFAYGARSPGTRC